MIYRIAQNVINGFLKVCILRLTCIFVIFPISASLSSGFLHPLGVNISFSALSYTISEGDSFLNVTVNKVGTTNFIALVTLQSSDGTALGKKLQLCAKSNFTNTLTQM